MAAVGPPGMANQKITFPTRAPDTSLHHIQEPPGRHHRDPTEPIQEESRFGPLGPSGISCHPSRRRPLDPRTTTTQRVGEGICRLGESQLHPDGHGPQQWPLGLYQPQRQHSTPTGFSGGSVTESSSTLHLPEHRVQQSQQDILPCSPMPRHQSDSSHTSGQQWLGSTAYQPHHFNRYILFVPDEVSNRQRPRVAHQVQTRSRPSGMGPQPVTRSTSSTA